MGFPSSQPPAQEYKSVSGMALRAIYPVYPVMGAVFASIPGARKQLSEVCCAFDSQVDWAFLVEVLLISIAQKFLGAVCVMNNFRRNSARILTPLKECYAQKNRSAQ